MSETYERAIRESDPRQYFKPVDIPEFKISGWEISKIEISADEADRTNLRMMIRGEYGREVEAGTITRLLTPGSFSRVMMSDTPAEISGHLSPVRRAWYYAEAGGEKPALVAGLGLGMVAEALLRAGCPRVDVVEIEPAVISLVAPTLHARWGKRIRIIRADIFEFMPETPRLKRYGVAWFDIWPDICTDNLDDMAKLGRRWAAWADWRGFWEKDRLRNQRRRDRAAGW